MDETHILPIKNMVCDRCVMVVTRLLERLGLHPVRVELGEAELVEPLPAARHVFTHKIWNLGGWQGHAPACALPEGWVWAAPEALETVYAVPNAYASYMKK